ncbi:hypothetical protein J8273_4935 [Carpediemonas membranifera]|uniref:Uncharacterized protein n=1 Tax=Carpediemonas membranifera TaxID=201153 RepID=A0A8J6AVL8_9EUKA|nr:hypothetical protein J8273_4935 [Carpediemonas membranifera]|eukprot:KAG9393635.1 hypothetical protein J8273_4935 [Carpediemonas membranifera]
MQRREKRTKPSTTSKRSFVGALGTDLRLDGRFITAARKNYVRSDVHAISREQCERLSSAMKTNGKLLTEITLNARLGVSLFNKEEERPSRLRPSATTTPEIHQPRLSSALVQPISHLIATSPRLHVFRLYGVPLTPKSLGRLVKALAKTKALKTLALVDCGISSATASAIFTALASVSTVEEVDLSHNPGIDDTAVAAAAHWITQHAERRDMDCFNMALHTSEAVADQRHKVHGPTTLALSHCALTDDGVGLLACSLTRDEYMTHVDVSGHKMVGTAGAKAVKACLAENRTLVQFDITSCPVYDSSTLTSIDRMLARNRRVSSKRDKAVERRLKIEAGKDLATRPPRPQTTKPRSRSIPRIRPKTAPSSDRVVRPTTRRIRRRRSSAGQESANANPPADIGLRSQSQGRQTRVTHNSPDTTAEMKRKLAAEARAHKLTLAELVRQKVAVGDLQMQVLELTAQRNTLASRVGESLVEPSSVLGQSVIGSDRILDTPAGHKAVEALTSAVEKVRSMLETPSRVTAGHDSTAAPVSPKGGDRGPVSPLGMRHQAPARPTDASVGAGTDITALSEFSDIEGSQVGSVQDFYTSLLEAGSGRDLVREVNRRTSR